MSWEVDQNGLRDHVATGGSCSGLNQSDGVLMGMSQADLRGPVRYGQCLVERRNTLSEFGPWCGGVISSLARGTSTSPRQ